MKRTTSNSSGWRERERERGAGLPGRWKPLGTGLLGLCIVSLVASVTMAFEAERPAASASDPEASAARPSRLAEAEADSESGADSEVEADRDWIARALESGSASQSEIAEGREPERTAAMEDQRDSGAAERQSEGEGEGAKSASDAEHGQPERSDERAGSRAGVEDEPSPDAAAETRMASELAPASGQPEQDGSHDGATRVDEPDPEQRQVQTEIDSLVSEFLATSEAVADRPDGKRPVVFTGAEERPDWYQALVVTNKGNPLLEEECKKEALSISVETLRKAHGIEEEAAALQQAAHHMREHQDFAASHAISYADYLHEIASCRAFCAPLVAHLVRCQVLAVSHSPHGIVLFDLDSDQVDPRYENGLFDQAVETLQEDPRSRVLLAGRASKIGDLRYNRRLSARRALAVRDKLIERGAPADRVKTMWFGWEPPQISSWIASRYGLDSLYAREGGHRMNQSVMLVIYPGSEDAGEKKDETVADSTEDEDVLSTAQLSGP